MVIKTTRWSPDTCNCVVEYTWDTDDPPTGRNHNFKNIVKVCPAHESLPNGLAMYDAIRDENPRKNKVLNAFVQNSDDIGESYTDDNGEPNRKLKDNIDFEYEFTGEAPNRRIEVQFRDRRSGRAKVNVRAQDRTKIESDLQTKAGINLSRVLIK